MKEQVVLFLFVVFGGGCILTFQRILIENEHQKSISGDSNQLSPVLRYGRDLSQDSRQYDVIIGTAVCGTGPIVGQAVTLLKSAILSSIHHGLDHFHAVIFLDEAAALETTFMTQVKRLVLVQGFSFTFEFHSATFPEEVGENNKSSEWKNLFRPCASQRLFFHKLLPNIKEILYIDADAFVFGDLRDAWRHFGRMSDKQIAAMVSEGDEKTSYYAGKNPHPLYPPFGLNTGIMLMNLTRIREGVSFDWEIEIQHVYKKYKEKIWFGDQGILNILFHFYPDTLYLMSCSFNFRSDHCGASSKCEDVRKGSDIHILHGNKQVFYRSEYRFFIELQRFFQEFDIVKGDYEQDLILPFKRLVETWKTIGNYSEENCENLGDIIFSHFSLGSDKVGKVVASPQALYQFGFY